MEDKLADSGSSPVNPDYEEYLRLKEDFAGERLKKLVRKLDTRVLPQLVAVYLLSYIDRSNVGNARVFGALKDLHMTGQDWNTALSLFFITYCLGMAPSNVALKRFGPRKVLPTLVTSVGVVLICSGVQSSFAGWIVFRLILGAVEAGVFPGCSFVLTNWYSPTELHTRMTIFYSGSSLAGAFAGLLAYGIGQLDHTWGYRGWRFIYIIEGLATVVLGLAAFFIVYPSPEHMKVSWLSEEEKRFLILRHRFSAGGDTSVAEDEAFNWKFVKQSLKSFHIYALIPIEFTLCAATYGASFTLPTIMTNLGYSAARAQAMTAPPYVFACVFTVLSGILADRYQKRMLSILIPNAVSVVGYIIIMASVYSKHVPGVTYFGVFLMLAGLYPISPAATAWISLNTAGSMKRAVSIGLMFGLSNLGGILGSNIYIAKEAPRYPVGFGVSVALVFLCGVVWPPMYALWLKRVNAQRAAIPAEEIRSKYTEEELTEMGDESPLFKYVY